MPLNSNVRRGSAAGAARCAGVRIVQSISCALLLALGVSSPLYANTTPAPGLPDSTVGLPVRVEQLVLPGTELEPAPWTDKTPLVIRIEAVYPHGTAFRYDLSYHGLEPGDYDLAKFLRRKDGASTADLPPLKLQIKALLPPGQIEPHALNTGALPWLGGYRALLVMAGILWVAVLVWIVYQRRPAQTAHTVAAPTLSLADRLRPLVTAATSGKLSASQLAELERAFVGYWRRRLGLDDLPPGEALGQLKSHAEAGPLITQLESWLHRPGGAVNVDVNALLAPYKNLPADALERVPVVAEATAR